MKKVTILVAAMLALSASFAMASGINFYVGECGAGTTTNTVTNTCTTNSGTAFIAYGSVIIPAVTKTGFIGTVGIVDVQNNGATVDDWWRADACRGTTPFSLVTDGTAATAACAGTVWDTAAPAGNNIQPQYQVAGSNQPLNRFRFVLGAVLLPSDAYDLTGDNTTELIDFKWTMLKAKSVGTGSCAGCANGVCMVLNEIQFQGLNDQSEADFLRVTNPITNQFISYNAAAGIPTCPDAVPVRNRTWGAVKALYR
jgi:hypothetical protein